jgi:hypothetical protein
VRAAEALTACAESLPSSAARQAILTTASVALGHTRRKQPLYTPTHEWLASALSDPRLQSYWSRAVFERAGLLDFAKCDEARERLASSSGKDAEDALTGMVDEWLFTFALTTAILAVEVCGA